MRQSFLAARSGDFATAGKIHGEFAGEQAAGTALGAGVGKVLGTAGSAIGKAQLGQKLFLSGQFGITSDLLGNSIAGVRGSLNQPGGVFKMGWSGVSENGGGMKLRIGILSKEANPNQAVFHFYVPKTFVPNDFANPSIMVKQALKRLEER